MARSRKLGYCLEPTCWEQATGTIDDNEEVIGRLQYCEKHLKEYQAKKTEELAANKAYDTAKRKKEKPIPYNF